jgi:hypothetical protein
MSLRKLCFYAMLATMLTFAAAEKLNRHLKEFDLPEMGTWANGPSLAASFRAESDMPPADFLPVQSKSSCWFATMPKAYSDSFLTGARLSRFRERLRV